MIRKFLYISSVGCSVLLTNTVGIKEATAMLEEVTESRQTKILRRDENAAMAQLRSTLTSASDVNWIQFIIDKKSDPNYIERGYGKRTRHGCDNGAAARAAAAAAAQQEAERQRQLAAARAAAAAVAAQQEAERQRQAIIAAEQKRQRDIETAQGTITINPTLLFEAEKDSLSNVSIQGSDVSFSSFHPTTEKDTNLVLDSD